MIDGQLIKTAIADKELTLFSQPEHFKDVWAGLQVALRDDRLDDFSPFIFAWSLLPMWSKLLLLSTARQDHADAFIGITDLTPLEDYNPRQLELLIQSCRKVLQTSVTLFSDWHFVSAFYPSYRDTRKKILAQAREEQSLIDAVGGKS